MHDHVLNFKADFDILGTENTMQLTTNVPITESYVWSDKPRNTMKLQRRFVENEDEGKISWSPNAVTQYTVINQDALNAYGEYRGYRILPASPTVHLTVLNSSNLARTINWATHDLFLTQHHDHEPRAAHPYNNQDIHDPPIDFAHFFNSESLVQEDLVVWFNLGMHHVPHTGDLPNTVFTTAQSAVHFMPVNYNMGDVSRRTRSQVRINYDGGNVSQVETFGQAQPSCGVDMAQESAELEEKLWGYTGDVVIRKFPYGE